jgi:hypothetical protein
MNSRLAFSPHELIVLLALLLIVPGCTDTIDPGWVGHDGVALFDGNLDPSDSSFVLTKIEQPIPGQEPVRVELIGSNLHIIRGGVALDVAIKNADRRNLYAPGMVWLSHFAPPEVRPRNADVLRGFMPPDTNASVTVTAYGFDYSEQFGTDRVLLPGETSAAIPWRFENPELVPFSFRAEALFSLIPDHAEITGHLFEDVNQNGIRDPDEDPFPWAEIVMRHPDGTIVTRQPGPEGGYRFPAYESGLYNLTFHGLVDCPICVTTPNPLEVLLFQGPNGLLQSFHGADFGAVCGLCLEGPVGLVTLTGEDPGTIEQDPYSLIDAWLEGDILTLQVGYGGCQSEHPFILYAGRSFTGGRSSSLTVQTWMLLAHDNLGEACRCDPVSRCWFNKTLMFDLSPIREAYIEDYGQPGVVELLFRDFNGNQQVFTFGP